MPFLRRLTKYLVLSIIAISILYYVQLYHSGLYNSFTKSKAKYPVEDLSHLNENCPRFQYGIVIDAGSTGSRIHVYKFCKSKAGLQLIDEVFEQLNPGLSSYASDPLKAAQSLTPLLDLAVASIPSQLQKCTPIIVRATAGLRLLNGNQADEILSQVTKLISTNYPFSLPENNAITIMDGKDEALYAWVTVNFLLKRLDSPHKGTTGIMDLGGGSTQIVFQPNFNNKNLITSTEPTCSEVPHSIKQLFQNGCGDFYEEKQFGKNDFVLYQHSHLGYGLMEGRRQVRRTLLQKALSSEIGKSYVVKESSEVKQLIESLRIPVLSSDFNADDAILVYHPCYHQDFYEILLENDYAHIKSQLDAHGKKHLVVIGGSDKVGKCHDFVSSIFPKDTCSYQPSQCSFNGIFQPHLERSFLSLDGASMFVFSYFYDRTRKILMLEDDLDIGQSKWKLRDIDNFRDVVCSQNLKNIKSRLSPTFWEHFGGETKFMEHIRQILQNKQHKMYLPDLCLDLSFIYQLLKTGYELSDDQTLIIRKKINGVETGWCLGAAIELIETSKIAC